MRLKRETKLGLATLAMVVVVLTTIAAVPGIFSSVNSTNGYQVNGSAGSSGQALCSDGTNYNTACTAGGGTITAVNVTSPITGGGSSGAVSIGLGVTGTSGTYAFPTSITTDTWGRISGITAGSVTTKTCTGTTPPWACYRISSDGTIEEWGVSSTFGSGVEGTVAVTFPHNFTSLNHISITQGSTTCNDTAGACGSGIHPYTCTPETTNTLTTSGVTMFWDGNGSTVQTGACAWHALGD